MISGRISFGIPAALRWLAAASLILAGCGGDGAMVAGGGTGGTGISTGAVSGFGSVFVGGVEYPTNAATKRFVNGVDRSALADRSAFAVGMVVTIHHAADDNTATQIDYQDNLRGPIAALAAADSAITTLGQVVVVDPAVFATLAVGDVVEVSGFADNAGRIRATYVEAMPAVPGRQYEIKGFVSALSTGDNTFRLGPLPDGSGSTVEVGYTDNAIAGLPGALANGMYVAVTTADTEPVGGRLAAVKVEASVARTEFPDGASVSLEGLVTRVASRQGAEVLFDVEGKAVRTSGATAYDPPGRGSGDVAANGTVLVEGTVSGGVVSAARVVFR